MSRIRKLGPGMLSLEADSDSINAENFIVSIEFDPGFSIGDPTALFGGNETPGEVNEKPKLKITAPDDYTEDSLLLYLHKHRGQEATFKFVPTKKGKLQVTGKCMLTPLGFGGETGKDNKHSTDLPVLGEYTLTADYSG